MVDVSRVREVVQDDPVRLQGSSEFSEGGENSCRVLYRWLNPEVQVAGRSLDSVRGERVSPDDQVAHIMVVEKREEVREIGMKNGLGHDSVRRDRTMPPGMSARS